MLKDIMEKNAHAIVDECYENFQDGIVCECYLQGVSDAVDELAIAVLDDYYAEFDEEEIVEEITVELDEVADVVLDALEEQGASLSELAFARKVLDDYIEVASDILDKESSEEVQEFEWQCKLA